MYSKKGLADSHCAAITAVARLLFQWLNGKEVLTHEGGHLPFEGAVTAILNYDKTNVITVAVNNTLTPTTLPPGEIVYKHNTSHGL
jgi:beta-galactosidase/beta-glucuronidase